MAAKGILELCPVTINAVRSIHKLIVVGMLREKRIMNHTDLAWSFLVGQVHLAVSS